MPFVYRCCCYTNKLISLFLRLYFSIHVNKSLFLKLIDIECTGVRKPSVRQFSHALELTTTMEILEISTASIHFDPPRMTVTAGFKARDAPTPGPLSMIDQLYIQHTTDRTSIASIFSILLKCFVKVERCFAFHCCWFCSLWKGLGVSRENPAWLNYRLTLLMLI